MSLLALPAAALAGVSGSDHDITGGAKLCFECHIPHNAFGDKLWFQTPSNTFTGVQDLCFTCHDGTPTSVGLTTAFDENDEQHAIVGTDCSDGGGGACHDVHNQNPNLTGKFLTVTQTNNSYCETCHDATMFSGAEGLGDHTANLTHFTDATFKCEQCHTAHGATPQTNNPVGLTNPILLADNDVTFYGAFCISCHNGTAPTAAVPGTGGQASGDVFNYADATTDHTGWKHPTTTTATSYPVNGCDKCHDVHDPTLTPTPKYLLQADNTESAFCASCHTAAGAPQVGANTHYTGVPSDVNMNNGLSPALPWANQIDEDGVGGADWPSATANMMVCESCHSVHREGYQTTPGYALRDDNSDNEICQKCHTDKG
jgi:predicted CXXCH cytochrome family protein